MQTLLRSLNLIKDQYLGHFGQFSGQKTRFLRELERLLVLLQLGEHSAQLQHETTVVACQVNRAFKQLTRWFRRGGCGASYGERCIGLCGTSVGVAIQPVRDLNDNLGGFLLVISETLAIPH